MTSEKLRRKVHIKSSPADRQALRARKVSPRWSSRTMKSAELSEKGIRIRCLFRSVFIQSAFNFNITGAKKCSAKREKVRRRGEREKEKENASRVLFLSLVSRGAHPRRHENSARRSGSRDPFRSPGGTLPRDASSLQPPRSLAQKAKNRAENSIMPRTKRELKRARQFREVRAIVKRGRRWWGEAAGRRARRRKW